MKSVPNEAESAGGSIVVLLARSAISARPLREMQRLTADVAALPGVESALFAFAEQGVPTLRDVVQELRGHCREILLLPMLLPVDPGFQAWLKRSLQRWRRAEDAPWPEIRIAPELAANAAMLPLLAEMVSGARAAPLLSNESKGADTAIVPAQKRRVLVCHGAPCNNAGAPAIWAHLRNEQERLNLRTTADGTMTAKSTCLGPCALAPVLQVFPEGTYYGGVDEPGIDRIVHEHLIDGAVVTDLAYEPTGRKHALRGNA